MKFAKKMTDSLVLLVGLSGSGKSTAAEILRNRHGYKEDMFAAPLKKFALALGFSRKQIYGTQAQKAQINEYWGISGRTFMQQFGTEVCRDAIPKCIPELDLNGRTLWARVMEGKITKSKKLVISDGRFEDEASLVRHYGGIIIKLEREGIQQGSHASEQNRIQPDVVIQNNGSLDDLENQIMSFIYEFKTPMNPPTKKQRTE